MHKQGYRQIILSSIMLLLAIGLGAFGAHALKDYLTTEEAKIFEIGSKYHFYGTFLMYLFAIIQRQYDTSNRAFQLMFVGTLLFSGSLYILSFRELVPEVLCSVSGPITPIGGLLMMLAAAYLIYEVYKKMKEEL